MRSGNHRQIPYAFTSTPNVIRKVNNVKVRIKSKINKKRQSTRLFIYDCANLDTQVTHTYIHIIPNFVT